jgi:hypothetical protein
MPKSIPLTALLCVCVRRLSKILQTLCEREQHQKTSYGKSFKPTRIHFIDVVKTGSQSNTTRTRDLHNFESVLIDGTGNFPRT